MAPATSTNSSPLAPAAVAADWSDFINTVGTSVGPLLTLFGEQTTKQFLSMSMGWLDNILLAMGPVGIITIVISAIRIGGSRASKALIGRYGDISDPPLYSAYLESELEKLEQTQRRSFCHQLLKKSANSGVAVK